MEKSINSLIYNRRKELGMTIEELANAIGVNKGTVSRWESGEIDNMRRDKITLLARALNISPLAIMGIDEEQPNNDVVTGGRDILKALFKSSPKAMALIDKMQVTDNGDVSISGVDTDSAEVITHALRGVMYALSMAQVTDDGKLEAVISLDAIFPPKKDG